METTKHIYLVSFGNSDEYRLETQEILVPGKGYKVLAIDEIENEIKEYLTGKFPGIPLAYYFTPKVTEISVSHESEYRGYKPLNDEALQQIKKNLTTEVENMEANDRLDRNAPYADV
ncbi:MAG: hypothetical protein NC328_02290 [Muribaculum sp.]|nr:hypothetical protein [Muribaculum sp.]